MSKSPEKKISIPENINVEIAGRTVRVKGAAGENSLTINNVAIGIRKEENCLILSAKGKFTKNEKKAKQWFKGMSFLLFFLLIVLMVYWVLSFI